MSTHSPKFVPRALIGVGLLAAGIGTGWAMFNADKGGVTLPWKNGLGGASRPAVSAAPWPTPPAMGAAPAPTPTGQPVPLAPHGDLMGSAPLATSVPGTGPAPPPPNGQAMADPTASSWTRPVVGLPGVPTILFGAQRPHSDRGSCTKCHSVVTGMGNPVPNIHSFSTMPHSFRGVCGNCHQVTIANGLSPTAAVTVAPGNAGMVGPTGPTGAPPLPPQANEGEWKGLEVRPSPGGVMVTKADGAAGRAGIQAGDVVTSINGIPMRDMNAFIASTQNGQLGQGAVIVQRNNQRLAFEVGAPAMGNMNMGNMNMGNMNMGNMNMGNMNMGNMGQPQAPWAPSGLQVPMR